MQPKFRGVISKSASPVMSMVLLCSLTAFVYSYPAPFWALPNEFLTGYSAAAGIALINSVGNLGGLVGPAGVGYFTQRFLSSGKTTRALASQFLKRHLLRRLRLEQVS